MRWWDRTIDLMILTHPHDDHAFGLIEILKRYKVKRVVYTGVSGDSPVYVAWKNTLEYKNAPVHIVSGKSSISLDEDCTLDLVYPIASIENKTLKI
jgi:competence protein ComEC